MKKTNFKDIKKILICALLFFGMRAASQNFYFESPTVLCPEESYFPTVVSAGGTKYLFYERRRENGIFIELKTNAGGASWEEKPSVAGPFRFFGEIPDIFSAASPDEETVCVAATLSDSEIGIWTSIDGGNSFTFSKIAMEGKRVVAPRLFVSKQKKIVLFASLGTEDKFSIVYSVSDDGKNWTPFSIFAPAFELDNSFSPYLSASESGDVIVFQSHFSAPGSGKTFQIYSSFSSDNLKSWSSPVLVTSGVLAPTKTSGTFSDFSNQNPVLASFGGTLWLSWERFLPGGDSSYICAASLTSDGKIFEDGGLREFNQFERSHRPSFYAFDSRFYLLWFDENSGVCQAELNEKDSRRAFSPYVFSESARAAFPSPVVFEAENKISFVWQKQEKTGTVYIVRQDKEVLPPKLKPLNFERNKKSNSENIRIEVLLPDDKSGIFGWTECFSKNESLSPSKNDFDIEVLPQNVSENKIVIRRKVPDEGEWFFKIRLQDNAGNWSDESVISYFRDTTPPQKVEFAGVEKDFFGFASSGSQTIEWKPCQSDADVTNYRCSLTKVSDLERKFCRKSAGAPSFSKKDAEKFFENLAQNEEKFLRSAQKKEQFVTVRDSKKRFDNLRNGIYVFSVCAVDEAGNTGEKSSVIFVQNKYAARTKITSLKTKKDIIGTVEVEIYGDDFTEDGKITEIYIDKDGKAPFDKTLLLSNGDFKILSNSKISGIVLDGLEGGTYGIYLNHSSRGIFPADAGQKFNKITVEDSGTVKIEHPYVFESEWEISLSENGRHIQVVDLLLTAVAVLAFLASLFAFAGILRTVRESARIQRDVSAILRGERMAFDKKVKTRIIQKAKFSLKFKLIGFTELLVLSIILMISISLGRRMIETQRETLVQSMREQVFVLMDGMSNGVQNSMNDALDGNGNFGLAEIVRQAETFAPFESASLIGLGTSGDKNIDYFWATTEKSRETASKLNTDVPEPGVSRFKETTKEFEIAEKCAALEQIAREKTGGLVADLETEYNAEKRAELSNTLNSLSRMYFGSIPEFGVNSLESDNRSFTFYYPVFYKDSGKDELLKSVLILQVGTEELVQTMRNSRHAIIFISVVTAVIAIAAGCFGAWFLGTMIVRPIKNLVSHVKVIAETSDKKALKDFSIDVKSHDEIGILGNAINDMTRELVKAAEDEEKAVEQEKMSLDGKAVQQTFLPLSVSSLGGKQSTASLNEERISVFGYYEGADAVSGDYFDYKKLDDRYYAIIKCDVSGHGVPAALIMTVVATLFRTYFENWSFKTHGTSLDRLVVQINDFIESLGVKGKFATLMICLFDTISGDVYMCNAGDNIIHIFDSVSRKEKAFSLHEAPAAGPLPSFMVEMKGGFKVEKITLKKGDILFLYTDGIEESTRFFRDSGFAVSACGEKSSDGTHGNHRTGQESEQLEGSRVQAVLEAVLNKKTFTLQKYHNPVAENLVFDFSELEGSVEDSIMALVAVEKVFRMYKKPGAKGTAVQTESGNFVIQGDCVKADRKIDAFLKKTFNKYDFYCSKLVNFEQSNYVYYEDLNEDPQADDLTLLAVQKK